MGAIPVRFLKPGMIFSEPVYCDGDNILVPAGVPVRQKDLDQLSIWGVETVETNGIPDNGYEDKGGKKQKNANNKDAAESIKKTNSVLSLSAIQKNKGAYRTYMSFIEQLDIEFLRISTGKNISETRQIDAISAQLLNAVRSDKTPFISFILGAEVKGFNMAKSSVNTAILSFLTAMELKFPHHKTLNIITAALLHDAGMLRLPKEIINKQGELSEKERRLMNSHTLLGYKIATEEFNYSGDIGDIVLQHHERWDGNGYPRRIAGSNINICARIVSIADSFEAMVCQKSYRNSINGYQAMKNLLADNCRYFDPDILKTFILTMGIYPIGSIVRLNNGITARVTEARTNAPLRPKIQVLIDEYKNIYRNEEGIIIDLLIEKNLYIVKTTDLKDIENEQEK